jgi:hypothetical protein
MNQNPQQRRVRCLGCDNAVTLNNLTAHVKTWHPGSVGQPRRTLYVELDGGAPPQSGKPRGRKPGVALVVAPMPVPVDEVLEPLEVVFGEGLLGPEDLDQIVLPVVANLTPSGVLPIAQLGAVLAWRDATALFLRAMSSTP